MQTTFMIFTVCVCSCMCTLLCSVKVKHCLPPACKAMTHQTSDDAVCRSKLEFSSLRLNAVFVF